MSEISKVEIIGLNHKCDVTFDLEKDCTIIIGENGIGKTSALKILQYLLSGMMSSVAGYVFDYIIISDSETIYRFSKDDFLVPIDVITGEFIDKCLLEVEDKDLLENYFVEMISVIKEKELLGKFLEELYYSKSFSTVLNRIIEQYFDPSILFRIELGIAFEYPCYEASPIYKSKFYKNLTEHKYWGADVIFGDMVEKIKYPFKDDSFVYFSFAREEETVKKIKATSEDAIKRIVDDYDNYKVRMFFSRTKSEFITRVDNDYFNWEDFRGVLLSALYRKNNTERVFDINSAIRALYFDGYVVDEVNEIAVEGVKKYWENLKEAKESSIADTQDLLDTVDKRVLYIHEQYIYPVLAEEVPYKINISKLVRRIKWCVENKPGQLGRYMKELCLLQSYMDIFEALSSIVLNPAYVSDSIRAFRDLVSEYIDDKMVCVTPKGLNVYLKEDEEMTCYYEVCEEWYEDSKTFTEKIVFGDVGTEIALNSLSSGECKIIMLAFYATFAERVNLIMDEPELSISILWQEKLIRDLLDYGQFQSIIVATHSPYIARDDSLAEFIEYLP